LLVLLAAIALGWNLNGYRLFDPDEGRNAEVAREMAHSNDYVVPHLDGLPYLDKPIVYFAAAAAMMELFGPTEAAARLPAYLATLATIGLLVWFARRRWGEEAGWLAGLAYATMVLPLAYARTAIFDSTLTLCTTAAIVWLADERPVAAWAAMAVGALTKGPIAVAIPLLALVPHALATGTPMRQLFPRRALAVFGAIALPWFIVVSIEHPDFPGYVFLRETLQRVATRSFHRTAPFWYYLPIVPVAAFPWIVPALARVNHLRTTWEARRNPATREPLLLACWVIVPLVFLSLNQSKLPQYVLPLIPALALAATRNLVAGGTHTAARVYVGVAAVAGVALVALTRWLPAPISLTPAEKAAIPPVAVALGIVVLCSAVLVGLGALTRRPRTIIFGYALVVMAIPFLSGKLLVAVGEDRSSAAIADATAAALGHAGGTGSVLGVLAYPPSLPFYLGRPIAVATESGQELTSNYIAGNVERFRSIVGSPLLPAGYWREALARCSVPTVFLTGAGHREARAALDAALPLLAADGHYAAYGPCEPHHLPQPPQPPRPPRRGGGGR
jgi:4-amino-4-deoxy-L-arabinose transferase-like glycosyltransferase